MPDLTTLFCSIDDFLKEFEIYWNKKLLPWRSSRGPKCGLSISEIITIVVLFHQSNFRTFKYFYFFCKRHFSDEFPKLPSYTRFVSIKKRSFIPLFAYLMSRRGKVTKISFIDATSIAVCKNKRITRNKVFKGLAERGKTTVGWFYGFKLHLIVNDRGEILSFLLTPGNIADVNVAETLSKGILGKLYGDKGYISKSLFKKLHKRGLKLFTTLRSNMKNKFLSLTDKLLLRKRSIIETINDQLKNISQIEHSRHRSPFNFLINLLAGLVAYAQREKKPSIRQDECPLFAF